MVFEQAKALASKIEILLVSNVCGVSLSFSLWGIYNSVTVFRVEGEIQQGTTWDAKTMEEEHQVRYTLTTYFDSLQITPSSNIVYIQGTCSFLMCGFI